MDVEYVARAIYSHRGDEQQTCKFHGGMAQGTGGGGGGVVGRRAGSSVLRALERTGYGEPLS